MMVRGMWSVCKWTGPGLMMMNTRNQLHNSAEIMSEHRTQPSSCSQTQYIDTSALLADYQSQHPSCDSETVKTWIVNAERYWVIITINRKHGKLRTINILCGEHPPLMSPLCGLFLGLSVAGCLSLPLSPLADSPDPQMDWRWALPPSWHSSPGVPGDGIGYNYLVGLG